MKAVVIHENGGLEKLIYEEQPVPKLSPSEVLVQVKACALNHVDLLLREGTFKPYKSLPHIMGCEVSGVVAEVGSEVDGLKSGQRCAIYPCLTCGKCEYCWAGEITTCLDYKYIGAAVHGGYAEYVKMPGANIMPIPDSISFDDAATIPQVFLTAWHMLVSRARIKPSDDVLIHAAGSGVGSAGIQVAKLAGARVIATASAWDKLELAKSLGADEVINYREKDFYQEVMRFTEKRGVDIVFEHTGEQTWEKSVLCLTRGGTLVTCGAKTGNMAKMDIRHVFSKQLNIIGSNCGNRKEMADCIKLMAQGKLKAVIHKVLPLKEARLGHQLLMDRSQFGKIILRP